MLGLLAAAAPHAGGTSAPLVFALGVAIAVAWVAIAVHAWHRARRRRAALGAPPGGGGADLLWLTPLVLALCSGFWVVAARGADPALALEAYLADWRAVRAEAALTRFVTPPASARALEVAWSRQTTALTNTLVRIEAAVPDAETDPARPLDGLRWTDIGATPGGGRAFALEVARRQVSREQLFGLLPTTSQRLVTVERVGVAELRPAAGSTAAGPFGPVTSWRVVGAVIAGEPAGQPVVAR